VTIAITTNGTVLVIESVVKTRSELGLGTASDSPDAMAKPICVPSTMTVARSAVLRRRVATM
jgi:hypothetical protein